MQLDESKKEMFRSVNDLVVESLQQVFDPEMPSISVYDLGLIYLLETNLLGPYPCCLLECLKTLDIEPLSLS